jgi:hypothetical protein
MNSPDKLNFKQNEALINLSTIFLTFLIIFEAIILFALAFSNPVPIFLAQELVLLFLPFELGLLAFALSLSYSNWKIKAKNQHNN